MVFKGVMKFLSSEEKISGKGNKYTISTFIQDGSADVLMCIDNSKSLLEFGQEVEGVFNYNPKYQKMEFTGVV